MSSLSRRLIDVDERQTIVAVLGEILQEIPHSSRTLELLDSVLRCSAKIHRHLTTGEIETRVKAIFDQSDPLDAIVSLSNGLQYPDAVEGHLSMLVSLFTTQLGNVLADSLISDSTNEVVEHSYSEFVSCVTSLTDRLSNAAARLRISVDVVSSWKKDINITISSSVKAVLLRAFEKISAGQDTNMRTVSLLVSQGRSLVLEQNTSFLSVIVSWLCSRGSDPIWDRLAQRILTDESHGAREFESLATAVVLSVSSGQQLLKCFGYAIRSSAAIKRVLTKRLLLQVSGPAHCPSIIAEYLALTTGSSGEIYMETLKNVLIIWSDGSGVKYNSLEQQKYLTRCVLALSKRVKDLPITSPWVELSGYVMKGVQERLGNSDICVRQSGMFVGEYCCSLMKPIDGEEPLKFDFVENEWLLEMKREVSDEMEQPSAVAEPEETTTTLFDAPSLFPPQDSQVASRNVLDSDDEDDFPQYALPDSEKNLEEVAEGAEPEQKHPAPHYIRDCMDRLLEKEKYEVFESAFFALESFIRRRAVGFDDIASVLMQRLLNLNNRFNTKNFETIRKDCLTATLAARPDLAPKLCDIMFSRECASFHRYLVLETLLAACRELAAPPKEDAHAKKSAPMIQEVENESWRAVVDARIRANTRMIGSKRAPTPAATANRLAPVATLFFYPLLRTTTEEHLQLKGRDAPFLSRILFTAGEILQCASSSPSIVKMASALATLVSPLRFHDEASVRASVLFTYFSIASSFSKQVFREVFASSYGDWLEWTFSIVEDPSLSEQDRTMAKHVAAILLEQTSIE